jgi:hypothetical protein
MTKITISFTVENKNVSVERELKAGEDLKETIEKVFSEIEEVGVSGKATSAQVRALYGKALDHGWSKEKIKEYLKANLGTAEENDIKGKVDRMEFSLLIDKIGGAVETPGKATVGQMRALWGKSLDKGWSREQVRKYLEDKLGTSKEEEIVGKINKETLSQIIDEI